MTNADDLTTRIRILISEALGMNLEEVPEEMAFGDAPQWDSMGHMEVMLRLEEQYGVELTPDTIGSLTSVTAIRDYLERPK